MASAQLAEGLHVPPAGMKFSKFHTNSLAIDTCFRPVRCTFPFALPPLRFSCTRISKLIGSIYSKSTHTHIRAITLYTDIPNRYAHKSYTYTPIHTRAHTNTNYTYT